MTSKCLGDMGDCCLPVIDTSRCVECICLNDNTTHATSMAEFLVRGQNVTELSLELSDQTRNLKTMSKLFGEPPGFAYYDEPACRKSVVGK